MDFDLSDDQLALRDGARALLDDLASPTRVRAHAEANNPTSAERRDGFDRDLWKAMVDQGWLGIEVTEEHGGVGLGTVEAAILAEEIGRHAAPVPFASTVLALDALITGGNETQAEATGGEPKPKSTSRDERAVDAWVGRLLAGDAIACVAWELDAPVVYAPSADVAIVVTEDGVGLLEIADRPPREPAMDVTRELGWLRVEAEVQPLGGPDARARLIDRGALFTSADLLGGASRALDMAVEYARDRVQFGRPIGSFQAVKHRCADMLVDVEGMRSTVYWAAWCIGAADAEASVAASTAKTWCADASKRVMASALQVHGGIGFTWEHDLHFFLKRAQLDQVTFGDAPYHRARLTSLLRPRVESGESVV